MLELSRSPVLGTFEERLSLLETNFTTLTAENEGEHQHHRNLHCALDKKVDVTFANVVSSMNSLFERLDSRLVLMEKNFSSQLQGLHRKITEVDLRAGDQFTVVKSMNGVMLQGFAGLGEVVELVKEQQELSQSVLSALRRVA